MRFPSVKANLGLLASSVLTLAMAACTPHQEAEVSYDQVTLKNAKISALTEKTAQCEEKIRGQILTGTPLLQNLNGIETYVADMNGSIAGLEQKRYSVTQDRKQFASVVMKNLHNENTLFRSYEYELGLNDSTSTYQMYLEVDTVKANVTDALQIKQRFNIGNTCELLLVSTLISQTLPASAAGQYTTVDTTYFSNGEKAQEQKKFSIPVTQTIASYLSMSGDLASMTEGMTINANGIATKLKITQMENQTSQDFARPVNLNMRRYSMIAPDGTVVMELYFGADAANQVLFEQNGNQKTWKVPQDLWAQTTLGTARLSDQTVSIQWPKDYLLKNSAFTVYTATAPNYDHLASYWSLSGGAKDPQTGLLKYSAVENRSASSAGAASALDLVSNDTIQTKLPRVQQIAQAILKAAPKDRRQQVSLILKWLKDNYSYDNEMVNNNIVRPLTTEEALNRGKGVCQHYSIIYTSIARALGVPTRIVMGYSIWGTEAGLHAWVESQFDGKLWQAIEPQFATGLKDTLTRNYLPLMRANQLEDKNSSSRDYFAIMLEATYILKAK